MLVVLIAVAVAAWEVLAENRDLLKEMFPQEATFEDAVYFPGVDSCKFFICITEHYYVHGEDCRELPGYPGQRGSSLSILGTGLEVVLREAFHSWGHLETLEINRNPHLRRIEDGAFSPLEFLTNLSISNNYNLETLSPGVFNGLRSLRELRFIKNNMKTLFSISLASRPFILPNLQYLDVSDNPIRELSKQDFVEMEGSSLTSLSLRLCDIYAIEPNTFSGFGLLKVLNLDNNKLATETIAKLVINLNKTAPFLQHLGLGSNFLNKNPYELLEFISRTNISSLDLKGNHFDFIMRRSFPLMSNIKILDLSSVLGYELQPWTFSSALPNLKRLIFTNNRLPGFVPALQLSQLAELDLSENVCENCPVHPHFEIAEHSMDNMTSLQLLILSNNYIYTISRFMFSGLFSLRELYLSNCSIASLEEFAFNDLNDLRHLDLSHNKILKTDYLSPYFFFGLTNLTSLRLDYCRISNFSKPDVFMFLSNLQYLTLRGNNFAYLDAAQFLHLHNLEILDVSGNHILPWNENVFHKSMNLQELILNSNHIYKYTTEMLEDFSNLKVLKVRYNPFYCSCSNFGAVFDSGIDYLNPKFGISDPGVKCYSPSELNEQRVIDYVKTGYDSYSCPPWTIIWSAICAIILVTSISCAVIVYYARWHIRYWAFLFRQKWRSSFPSKKRSSSAGKYKYDAFVSYSNEDRNFVIRLVAMLENYEPYYRLCVFERDFKAGDIISQSVVDCLSSSRKSILILTDAFARSQWCQWELQMAHHKRIFFKQEGKEDSLLLIKLGDVMENHMTPTLRYLMKTRIYLQWHSEPKRQRIFWQKLRDALKPLQGEIIQV